MSRVTLTEQYLQDTADAIREKTGDSRTITPAGFADAIAAISGSGWTLVHTTTVDITYTATSTNVLKLNMPEMDNKKPVLVIIRDTAGARPGYFFGAYALGVKYGTSRYALAQNLIRYDENGELKEYRPTQTDSVTAGYGVWVNHLITSRIGLGRRYSATSSYTIDGTFQIDIYQGEFPCEYPEG